MVPTLPSIDIGSVLKELMSGTMNKWSAVQLLANIWLGVARSTDRGDAVRGPLDRAIARYAVHTNTWDQELFCHQMGPYQTLRADTLWTLLLMLFRVLFIFWKCRNHPT